MIPFRPLAKKNYVSAAIFHCIMAAMSFVSPIVLILLKFEMLGVENKYLPSEILTVPILFTILGIFAVSGGLRLIYKSKDLKNREHIKHTKNFSIVAIVLGSISIFITLLLVYLLSK